jgi:hypothetical protein
VPEKRLWDEAKWQLPVSRSALMATIGELGKAAGPPWGRDQKSAALAAIMGLAATVDSQSH